MQLSNLVTGESQEPRFAGLLEDIESNGEAWQDYYDLEAPEESPLPCGWSNKLDPFGHLLLLRCLRMDRVTVAVTRHIIGACFRHTHCSL